MTATSSPGTSGGTEQPCRAHRPSRISQRWLRDLVWGIAGVLRSAGCPRSGRSFDGMRRAGLELSAFLELRLPAAATTRGCWTPGTCTGSPPTSGSASGTGWRRWPPGAAAAGYRSSPPGPGMPFSAAPRRLLRGTLESGEADRLGLDRGFITAMPGAEKTARRARPPFTDEAARALADEDNLAKLARHHDRRDHGMRDIWETIIVTGRRCREVLGLRLDCLGRYGGLPVLWHDQSKIGNYDEAVRIPERTWQLLQARQRKTLVLFQERNNRQPTAREREQPSALFPTNLRSNRDCRKPLSYTWFRCGFSEWLDGLDIGRWVPHQARHSLATNLLRPAPA